MNASFFSYSLSTNYITGTVVWLFTEYDVARAILKFQCKTWEFRATSYSVNSKAIKFVFIIFCSDDKNPFRGLYEPRHDKTNKMSVHPVKTLIKV